MRVGIALPLSHEQVGGGYRFEQDVYEAILPLIADSPHHFVLIGSQQTLSAPLPGNVSYLSLYAPAPTITRAVRRARRMRTRAHNALHRLGLIEHGLSSDAERAELFQQHGIQCLLHFGPHILCRELPYLVFVWDLEHRCQPYFPELSAGGEWDARERYFREVLPRASAIVTGTELGRRQIERFYGVQPERILTLRHPTPSDALALARQVPPRSQVEGAGYSLLYPAQFWPHKNHIGLLRALARLEVKSGLRPKLILTGSDPGNRSHVENMARELGLAGRIEFAGFVPRERLLELYTQVDALVYPTTFGPENLPPLEAFALSCPVAATRIPGADEQLGDAALLFDPHDSEGMADAIERVLTDGGMRTELVARGRARAAEWTSADVAKGVLRWLDRFSPVRDLWP